MAPAERDGHSLSGQVRVSSAICFAEGMTGMTAYLYAHNVWIFATTRFLPGPTAIDCGKTRNGWLRKAGSKSSSSARGTSAKRIWSKPSWPSAGDNWGWWPSFPPWNLVPPTRWCQSRPFRANREATYSADFAGADLRDQALFVSLNDPTIPFEQVIKMSLEDVQSGGGRFLLTRRSVIDAVRSGGA